MKNLLLLVIVAGLLYFGYRWWEENMKPAPVATSPSRSVEDVSGGPVREWQRAPDNLMETNKALGGGPGSGKAAHNVVRDKLGQTR